MKHKRSENKETTRKTRDKSQGEEKRILTTKEKKLSDGKAEKAHVVCACVCERERERKRGKHERKERKKESGTAFEGDI